MLAIFAIALISTIVVGMIEINTEEIQLMKNQINAADALAVAEAGLNRAFYEIRQDPDWDEGFENEPFAGRGTYSVEIDGEYPEYTLVCSGSTDQGFSARVEAEVMVGNSSPYRIRIDSYRINE